MQFFHFILVKFHLLGFDLSLQHVKILKLSSVIHYVTLSLIFVLFTSLTNTTIFIQVLKKQVEQCKIKKRALGRSNREPSSKLSSIEYCTLWPQLPKQLQIQLTKPPFSPYITILFSWMSYETLSKCPAGTKVSPNDGRGQQ